MATSGRAVLGRDMLFDLTSVIYWHVVTATKKRQVDIDNVIENSRNFKHDYIIGNQVYVKNTDIYCKLYYKKQEP